jgi:hypothetical protein
MIIKVEDWQPIHFDSTGPDGEKTHAILIYARGVNGILYEMSAGQWTELPIDSEAVRKIQVQTELTNNG